MKIEVRIAHAGDIDQALSICNQIEESARVRKTGIAKRDSVYIKKKMIDGNAVIAFCNTKIAGFSYIETFQDQEFVANSGMIVFPEFRQHGIAKLIKSEIFRLSREKFPKAKIFSITTSIPVLKMNIALGFKPVNFKHLTQSEDFWKGCKSCANYDILTRNQRKMCLCSGLLYNPSEKKPKNRLLIGDKILLAYSGGLDTSYCLKYLINQGYEVHTAVVNTGGFNKEELRDIEKKAYIVGSKSHRNIEAKKDYYDRCIKYLIFGNVLRNNTYPLSVSSERFFQAIKIAEYANDIGSGAIGHGSTGAGNDQVRFDLAFQILCPDKLIISPIRDMKLSRREEMDYLKDQGVDTSWEKARYSINKGLWGTSIGGNETLSSDRNFPEDSYQNSLKENESRKIKLEFKKGELIAIDGKINNPVENILELEKAASRFAIGRDIHVGDTLIGIKGRVGFEAASAMIILKAHHLLEKHVLSKWQLYWKEQLSNWYGMLLHEAQYLDPVMRDIEAFLIRSQERVSGKVNVRLHPFRFELIGIESPFDIMQSQTARYGEINQDWSAEEIKGFIKIFGNQMKIYHGLTLPNYD